MRGSFCARVPFRISFFGGGTDFKEWYKSAEYDKKGIPNKNKEFKDKLIKMQSATQYGYTGKSHFNFTEKVLPSESDDD